MRRSVRKAVLSVGVLGALSFGANAAPINYTFTLAPVNNSGVTGSGTMVLNGTQLTVSMTATGLVPNQSHPEHIHGLLGAAAPSTTIAPPSADVNHDGYVETPEGLPYEGPPIYDLPPSGTPGNYSTAPAGVISFTQTYDLSNPAFYDPMNMVGHSLSLADIEGTTGGNTIPLIDRLVELHGLVVPAAVAAVDGISAPAGTSVYDPLMPVAAGMIQLASVPEPGTLALLAGTAAATLAMHRRRRPPRR